MGMGLQQLAMASMTGMDAGGNAQTIDVGQVKSKFQVNTSFLIILDY